MARIACAAALLLVVVDFAGRPQAGQASPSFEVASVRKGQSPGDPILALAGIRRGNSWLANSATLRMLIRAAYAPQFQTQGTIIAGPDWADTDRFDVMARLDPSVSADTVSLMVQALLAERFKLVVHRESRELPVYALVLARTDRRLGPQLRPLGIDCEALRAARQRGEAPPEAPYQPGTPPGDCRTVTGYGPVMGIESGGMTMAQLAVILSRATRRPVIDQTGLSGDYALTVEFTTDGTIGTMGETGLAPVDAPGLSVFAAVEQHLGLKLESRRSAVDVLVIDRAEQPSPN